MKKQSDEEKLISELLAGGGELARATLAHGLTLSRRKRARRRAWRAPLVAEEAKEHHEDPNDQDDGKESRSIKVHAIEVEIRLSVGVKQN